jgi:leucyl aminopeptidase (aminopeptidase T)
VLIVNEGLNITTQEPVMMRVPADSLTDLATYAEGLAKTGIPYHKLVTQIGFDEDAAYPKLKFAAYGWDDDAVEHWEELRNGETVKRILSTYEGETDEQPQPVAKRAEPARAAIVHVPADEDQEEEDSLEEPAEPVQKKQAKRPAKKPVADEVEEVSDDVSDVDEGDIDNMVNNLLGLS